MGEKRFMLFISLIETTKMISRLKTQFVKQAVSVLHGYFLAVA